MMNESRYAPPVANVGDVADVVERPRPRQVTWAVRLLWATLILWVIQDCFEVVSASAAVPVAAMTVSFLVTSVMVAFAGYVNVSIYRGRNWARILTLILTILSTALVIFGPSDPTASAFERAFTAVNTTSDAVCMYLLFASPGSTWFKKRAR